MRKISKKGRRNSSISIFSSPEKINYIDLSGSIKQLKSKQEFTKELGIQEFKLKLKYLAREYIVPSPERMKNSNSFVERDSFSYDTDYNNGCDYFQPNNLQTIQFQSIEKELDDIYLKSVEEEQEHKRGSFKEEQEAQWRDIIRPGLELLYYDRLYGGESNPILLKTPCSSCKVDSEEYYRCELCAFGRPFCSQCFRNSHINAIGHPTEYFSSLSGWTSYTLIECNFTDRCEFHPNAISSILFISDLIWEKRTLNVCTCHLLKSVIALGYFPGNSNLTVVFQNRMLKKFRAMQQTSKIAASGYLDALQLSMNLNKNSVNMAFSRAVAEFRIFFNNLDRLEMFHFDKNIFQGCIACPRVRQNHH